MRYSECSMKDSSVLDGEAAASDAIDAALAPPPLSGPIFKTQC